MKDIKSVMIGFLLATCMFLFMGATDGVESMDWNVTGEVVVEDVEGDLVIKTSDKFGQFSGFASNGIVFLIDTKSADTWIWNSGIKMWEFQEDANIHLINHYDNYRH